MRRTLAALFGLTSIVCAAIATPSQHLSMIPSGRLHVQGNLLLDETSRSILLRGTELEELGQNDDAVSATTFSTIRQRWNMNVVRLPIKVASFMNDVNYRRTASAVVSRANKLELLVIVASSETNAQFWGECAKEFKNRSGVLFEVTDPALVRTIRSQGADQPILVRQAALDQSEIGSANNIVQEVFFRFGGERPKISGGLPTVIDALDPECPPPGTDPSEIEELVGRNLAFFDSQNVSWIVSAFRPGRLILNYRNFDGSRLESGFSCDGTSLGSHGIGLAVQFHLWNTKMLGLFTVSGPTGSFVLPRGGLAVAYGPILATAEGGNDHGPLPNSLGGVSVRVTDFQGKARLAGIIHVLAGWGQINFVVPDESAPGPAEVAILRSDGSVVSGPAMIAEIAPGLSGKEGNGRGPATGQAIQRYPDGHQKVTEIGTCDDSHCWTNEIRLSPTTEMIVKLVGNGVRHVRALSDLAATIGGIGVPVLAHNPGPDPGLDQITLRLPMILQGMGESDLIVTAGGHVSNVVRIQVR